MPSVPTIICARATIYVATDGYVKRQIKINRFLLYFRFSCLTVNLVQELNARNSNKEFQFLVLPTKKVIIFYIREDI